MRWRGDLCIKVVVTMFRLFGSLIFFVFALVIKVIQEPEMNGSLYYQFILFSFYIIKVGFHVGKEALFLPWGFFLGFLRLSLLPVILLLLG